MDSSEPREPKADDKSGVSINVNSPDNRIASHDYIEVHISIGKRDSGEMPSIAEDISEIRKLVGAAIDCIRERGAQRTEVRV